MPTQPDDIVNEALDEIGVGEIGDIFEGSPAANVARRVYDPMLRAMHAAAPWNFARREAAPLSLIGDSLAQYNPNTVVSAPWRFMYEWPIDCVHARYVKDMRGYAYGDSGPLYSLPLWNRPAPFLVADAPIPNDIASSWDTSEGHNPESTRVILTNQLGAVLVYTGIIQYPDAWDPLFRRAFSAALSARFAVPLIPDKKLALQFRRDNIGIARDALIEARVRDGNEGWTVVDHTPDWIMARTGGSPLGDWCYSGWSPYPFLDAGGVY